MNTMEKDLQEAIKKNLPAHVGETLQAELERLKKIEEDYTTLKGTYKYTSDLSYEKDKEISNLKSVLEGLKEQKENLDAKEAELWKKEKDLELREIRISNEIVKRESAEKNAENMKEVIGIVFKNPVVQRSVVETNGGQWNWSSERNRIEFCPDGNNSKTETETTT